jgi:hypothetical protein
MDLQVLKGQRSHLLGGVQHLADRHEKPYASVQRYYDPRIPATELRHLTPEAIDAQVLSGMFDSARFVHSEGSTTRQIATLSAALAVTAGTIHALSTRGLPLPALPFTKKTGGAELAVIEGYTQAHAHLRFPGGLLQDPTAMAQTGHTIVGPHL